MICVIFGSLFKKAYKAGTSFLIASIAVTFYIVVAEILDHMPVIGAYLEGEQLRQLTLLFVGLIIFIVSFFVINRQCAKNYEKVDL